MKNLLMDIECDSKLPKYQQFVNTILGKINAGELQEGDKLPSIVSSSIDFDLSRDTVGRAYKELFCKGVITSIYRKGYFISNTSLCTKKKRILFITGKSSTTNQMFYHQFTEEMEKHQVQVDYMLNHNSLKVMKNIINKEIGNYHVFVIESQLLLKKDILSIFNKKTLRSSVVFLNDDDELLPNSVNHISLNIDETFHSILGRLTGELGKYRLLYLVLPEYEYFSSGLIKGFFKYCDKNAVKGQIVEEFTEVQRGGAYFVIDESSFFKLVNLIEKENLELGKDIGLITLFEKEYLKYMFNGITTINWFNRSLVKYITTYIIDENALEKKCSAELFFRKSI